MKKLKLNKKFKPLPCDEGEEFCPNGIFEFNVTKLLRYIKENSALFPVEQISVSKARAFTSPNLDEKTIQTADLSIPIILAEIAPGRFNAIDGRHRLERAFREGMSTIPTYRVTVDHHPAFLTSERAYQTYVKYWNEKIDELEG